MHLPESPRSRARFALFSLLVAALAPLGCAPTPAARAAEQGQFDGLRASLAAEVQQGQLGPRQAASFAKALARGEVRRAKGEEGAQRIRDFAICAREVEGALDDRADTHDALGAVAALVLLDAGVSSPGSYSRWVKADAHGPEAAWRAPGARSLSGGSDGPLRRQMIADADEEVRRSALHAALAAADPEDTEAVLEAARVDPSAAARAQAIRAAGAIGGERAVLALVDLWPHADEAARESIVAAWAMHPSFNSGGRRELIKVVDRGHGRAAIAASLTLMRAGGDGADGARGALERAVREGPSAARVRAIEVAPLALSPMREAVLKASTESDEAVAAAATARLFESPPELGGPVDATARASLAERLLKLAESGAGSLTARGALARAHDPRLLPLLTRDGEAKEQKTRAEAGAALAVYGDLPRAAVVAADPEPRVRVAVACAILRAWAAR